MSRIIPYLRYATLLCGVCILGCATLDEAACRRGDWQAVGFHDGSHGYDALRFDRHREACAKYAIVPDQAAWAAGRQAGLARYCRVAQAWQVGRKGGQFNLSVCADNAGALQAAYERGMRVHELEDDIKAQQQQRTALQDELRAVDSKTFASQREAFLYRDNLRLRLAEVERELAALKRERTHALYQQPH